MPQIQLPLHPHLRRVAVSLLLALGGCSLLTVTPPPRIVSVEQKPKCTTTRAAPVLDAILGAGAVVAGGYEGFIATALTGKPGYMLAAIVPGVLLGGSSVYGFVEISRCDDAEGHYEREYPAALVAPSIGAENNLCRPATIAGQPGTCDPGLSCLDNVCVTPCQKLPAENDAWACDGARYDRCDERHVCVAAHG